MMQGSFSVLLLHVLLGALVTEVGISILLVGICFIFLTSKISRGWGGRVTQDVLSTQIFSECLKTNFGVKCFVVYG